MEPSARLEQAIQLAWFIRSRADSRFSANDVDKTLTSTAPPGISLSQCPELLQICATRNLVRCPDTLAGLTRVAKALLQDDFVPLAKLFSDAFPGRAYAARQATKVIMCLPVSFANP